MFPYEIKYNIYASLPCYLAINIYRAITISVLVIIQIWFNFAVGSKLINKSKSALSHHSFQKFDHGLETERREMCFNSFYK